MKIFIVAAALLLSLPLFAATISEIKFVGMVHISESVAKSMLKVEVGDELDVEQVDETVKAFFEQGYFTDIWADAENGVLTFHFVEKPVISKIKMSGWKESDKDIQESLLQIKKGALYDEERLQAAKKRIVEALSQEGKIDSVVEIETEYLDNGSVAVEFKVNEGETIIIEELQYSGNKGLDAEVFEAQIANKAQQWMGWFWGRNDGKMQLAELGFDPLRIRDVYMQNGYLDAKVDEPFVRVDFDSYTAQMSYQLSEGEVYRVSGIVLSQSHAVIDEAILREVVLLQEQEPFNIKTFREDADRIKTKIADLGYAFVQVNPDLRKDKENRTVEVVFRIMPGEKVYIRNVIIAGNGRTLDRIVRRELYLGPGERYNLTDLRDSKNALGRTGYFESSTIEEKRIDEKTMDLIVKVKEAPTGNVQLGGGYGSYGGILLSVGVNDRNIFGSGINVGVKLEHSQRTENYSFNISNPRLNDSDFSGNFSIYKSVYQYNDYSVNSDGVTMGIGHRFTRFITGYLGYNYAAVSYDNIDPQYFVLNPQLVQYFESYNKSSVTVSANYDNTDDYYLPRSGWAISQSFEKAGVGADANFFKSRSTVNKYNGLEPYVGFDAIFRWKNRYFAASDTGFLPQAEGFYMGGLGSVRGYESYSLPYIIDGDGNAVRVSATQTASSNLELSFPLVPKAKMRFSIFYDVGWIRTGRPELGDVPDMFRMGYGAGLEWFSPVGPLQLVFANPVNPAADDKISHFEFTIGQRF
ncbi:MAG: outer membrane protein assembly factor BamA [Helicobacteraceae bacterium]|jgi:outer membrane protein insertion porin family|nr:outer membrane protein assembly factor BamA [Helicobacteraceae bacterium]